MSLLRWTSKSTAKLAGDLVRQGFEVSEDTVGRILKRLGYSLQSPAKVKEGTAHRDRDGQFRYLHGLAQSFVTEGEPVISVDTKKSTWSGRPRGSDEMRARQPSPYAREPAAEGARSAADDRSDQEFRAGRGGISPQKELIGDYANGGREWQPSGEPELVNVHDFADRALGEFTKAIPYGVYDVGNDEGWVSVGDSADTAEFAVESIRRWWQQMGAHRFPTATRLLITADAGGSNGPRVRAWKWHLARLAAQTGLEITVCHYPPGTSKWNRIEHRLFSFISMNRRGRSLTDIRTIVELIAGTKTKTGLAVQCAYDTNWYPTGEKVTDAQFHAIPLTEHDWHGDWNYTIHAA